MPVPIVPVNTDSLMRRERNQQISTVDYGTINIDDLASMVEKRSNVQDIIRVSNFEAGVLFKLWKEVGEKSPDGSMEIPSVIGNSDILRLKASGLISGNTERFKFTPRGEEVIKTLVLSEENSFDKTAEHKTYEQVVKENKKRFSGGPRLSVGKPK